MTCWKYTLDYLFLGDLFLTKDHVNWCYWSQFTLKICSIQGLPVSPPFLFRNFEKRICSRFVRHVTKLRNLGQQFGQTVELTDNDKIKTLLHCTLSQKFATPKSAHAVYDAKS